MRALVFSLLLLSGCSSIYHPQEGWVPEGYSEQRESEHQYSVRFQSYRGEDWLELKALLLYRAAELGGEQSYKYFLLSDLKNTEKVEVTETQAIKVAGYNAIDSSAATEIPYNAFHHKIRTVDALITYTDTQSTGSYEVAHVLATTQLDK